MLWSKAGVRLILGIAQQEQAHGDWWMLIFLCHLDKHYHYFVEHSQLNLKKKVHFFVRFPEVENEEWSNAF